MHLRKVKSEKSLFTCCLRLFFFAYVPSDLKSFHPLHGDVVPLDPVIKEHRSFQSYSLLVRNSMHD